MDNKADWKDGLPPASYIVSVLNYDSDKGQLIWKHRTEDSFKQKRAWVSWNNRFEGKFAGCVVKKKNKKYLKVNLGGKNLYAHRVIWAILNGENPSMEIDHINGDSLDNHISNLREVTRAENCRNVQTQLKSKSGHCGVTWSKSAKKWRARVKHKGSEYHLGVFDDIKSAVVALKSKRQELGFHANHGEAITRKPK